MEQFKTLDDLRTYLAQLEQWFGRPIAAGEHPLLYLNGSGNGNEICGIRRIDYLFSQCGNWILPSREHGLSFSSRWQHLKAVYKMKVPRNPGKAISVYWVLEKADIPPGLAFVPAPKDGYKGHYLLCATTRMYVEELRTKLEWIADRMSVIHEAEAVL